MLRGRGPGRRPRAFVATLCALVPAALLLTACSPTQNQPTSTIPAASVTSASPAGTSIAVPPSISPNPSPVAEPLQQGDDGAIRAAVYFAELFGYAVSTRDFAAWTAMSGPECGYCASVVDGVTSDTSFAIGGATHVDDAWVDGRSDDGGYYVGLFVTQDAWRNVDASGATVDSGEASSFEARALMSLDPDSGWKVSAFDPSVAG